MSPAHQAAERSRRGNEALADTLIQNRLFPDEPEPGNWHCCASLAELADGKGLAVNVDGQAIAIFLDSGRVAAIDARCPHAGAPLNRGWLENGVVTCPLHRWKFEITTGRCLTDPSRSIRSYRTRVDETGTIWVESESRSENPDRQGENCPELDENR